MTGIYVRFPAKVLYLFEPKLTYKFILQITQSEFNATLITKLTSLYNLIVLIQELIQIHSCGALTRYKKKVQISTKEQVLKVQQNNPLTSYKPEKINNERVSLITK
jgi:hypothetical protein